MIDKLLTLFFIGLFIGTVTYFLVGRNFKKHILFAILGAIGAGAISEMSEEFINWYHLPLIESVVGSFVVSLLSLSKSGWA